jgi:hypothetical protein
VRFLHHLRLFKVQLTESYACSSFVLISNSPIPSHLNAYADFADRFWYWRGASGRHYIHSVYKPGRPPLRGGVYVAVRREGDLRQALAVGLFSEFWDEGSLAHTHFRNLPADEIHIHLLAGIPEEARAVAQDLKAAMRLQPKPPRLISEEQLSSPSTAEARAA